MMSDSDTYPDRLFFLGGVDSLRGYLRDSVVPQDVAERLLEGSPNDPNRLTVNQVAIRGGDVFLNPRLELRIPMTTTVHTTLFVDSGNLWVEPEAFAPWKLRYASGSGLRVATPIGPLAFDYGINLDRRPWEDFGAFHFSIGLF
jgi:outer membrane translocation and assembly module TamA